MLVSAIGVALIGECRCYLLRESGEITPPLEESMRGFRQGRMKESLILGALLLIAPHSMLAGTSTEQSEPTETHAMPPDSSLGIAIACTDARTGGAFAFQAKRVLLSGVIDTSWTPDAGRLCLGASEGTRPQIVPDGAGGAFVGWVEARQAEPDIYLQRFTSEGSVASGWPVGGLAICEAPYSQYHLEVTSDGAGGVYLAWEDYRRGSDGDIYVARVSSDGELQSGWPAGGLAVCAAEGEQSLPKIATDASGGAFVAWQDRRTGVLELYLQHLSASGAAVGGWEQGGTRLAVASPPALEPILVADSLGTPVLIWTHQGDESTYDLLAAAISTFLPGVAETPPLMTLSQGATEYSAVVAQKTGAHGVIAGWGEWRSGSPSVRAQLLNLSGGLASSWSSGGVSVYEGAIGRGALTLLSDGVVGTFVGWEDYRNGDESDLYLQRLTGAGAIAEGWPVEGFGVCSGSGAQSGLALAADNDGVLATWARSEVPGGAGYLRAMELLSMPAPKLRIALARPHHAKIVWRSREGAGASFTAYRRLEEGEWEQLWTLSTNDSADLVLDDRTIPDGAKAEYRLAIQNSEAEVFFPPVSLEIPHAPTVLTLHAARGRGSEHSILVTFALPNGPPPIMDLLDVMGRRVANRRFDGLEPGEQSVSFNLPPHILSGVYFLRLIQGNERRNAKVIYVR